VLTAGFENVTAKMTKNIFARTDEKQELLS
jgi:hypothetical protein